MIISPPFIRAKNNNENDAHWIERMMPVEPAARYPLLQECAGKQRSR